MDENHPKRRKDKYNPYTIGTTDDGRHWLTFSDGTETVTYEAAHQFDKQGRKGVQATRENISKAKEHFEQRKVDAEQPKASAGQHSPNAEQHGATMEQRGVV